MVVTFALTVVVDLTVAIQVGVILSAMLFIRRMAEVSQVTPLTRDLKEAEEADEDGAHPGAVPEGVEVFEVFGTLFFGAVEQFTETMRTLERPPKVFILETRNLLAIDATGIRAIEDLVARLKGGGTSFILSGIHKQPLVAIAQAGLVEQIGEDNLCGTLAEALERARAIAGS
jgi:SulP family sulfate permease